MFIDKNYLPNRECFLALFEFKEGNFICLNGLRCGGNA